MTFSNLIKVVGLFAVAATVAGCGDKAPPNIDEVVAKLGGVGVQINDITKPERDPDSLLPNSYKDRVVFSIPAVAPQGGQVFVCDTKKNCDALYQYFDALKAFAGPYIYQSQNGLVVMQLDRGLNPDEAAKLGAVVAGL